MCWSAPASIILTSAGLGGTIYAVKQKKSKLLWLPLLYFSLMEGLQVVQYFFIDQCGLYINQLLTVLGFIHIAFQPFFINAFALYFVPKKFAKKIAPWVYTICFLATVAMLLQLYPFHAVGSSASACIPGQQEMCGNNLCTVSGEWHLAWNIPLSMYPHSIYISSFFLFPLLYGSWKITLVSFLIGPLLVSSLSSNINERPAIWCFLSVAYILIIILSPLQKWLRVKKWYFWKFKSKKIKNNKNK